MKKRNLILSVVCSMVLVFVLVGFAIVELVRPAGKQNGPQNSINVSDTGNTNYDPSINEGEDKGSVENPYYIYDVETFNSLLTAYGADSDVHFQLLEDIDFNGVNYIPLFNKGTKFSAVLDGNGHTVRNIAINVTPDNIKDYAYIHDGKVRDYASFELGVFGHIDGAEISNITFENISVSVDNAVYSLIRDNAQASEVLNATVQDITVGAIAAYVENATISANLTSTINADAYSVYVNDETDGTNALGGAFGTFVNSTLEASEISTTIVADSNSRDYWIGGVAGYMNGATLDGVVVNANVRANALPTDGKHNRLYIAGVAGFGAKLNLTDMIVNFNATQIEAERYTTNGINSIDRSKFNMVAGIVSALEANDASQKTNITRVEVHSNVNMDAMFAGVVYTVLNEDYDTNEIVHTGAIYITIEDSIIDSEVNTLCAYGIAAQLIYTEIKFNDNFAYANYRLGEDDFVQYAVKLTGNVRLASDVLNGELASALVSVNENNAKTGFTKTLKFNYQSLKMLISSSINSKTLNPNKVTLQGGTIV